MWQIDDNFIETCKESVKMVGEGWKEPRPFRLKSFTGFEDHQEEWFDQMYSAFSTHVGYESKSIELGRYKGRYVDRGTLEVPDRIPILEALSEHLFSKIYREHKIAVWITTDGYDKGTDWHTDFDGDVPTYLICMNLVGTTHWQFDGYDDMILKPGDVIAQNGSVPHKVHPIDGSERITLAGHRTLLDIIC